MIRLPVYDRYEDNMAIMSKLSDDVFRGVIKDRVRCGKCGDLPLCAYIKADATTYFTFAAMM